MYHEKGKSFYKKEKENHGDSAPRCIGIIKSIMNCVYTSSFSCVRGLKTCCWFLFYLFLVFASLLRTRAKEFTTITLWVGFIVSIVFGIKASFVMAGILFSFCLGLLIRSFMKRKRYSLCFN